MSTTLAERNPMRTLSWFGLFAALGCANPSVADLNVTHTDEQPLAADYERQEPAATGPQGIRLVSGLYTKHSSWYGWGCGVGHGEPTVSFGPDEVELNVLGSCSASYRRAGAVWYTDVDGYFRLIDLGPQMPQTTEATIEMGVWHDGYAIVGITQVGSDGSETTLCDVSMDSRDAREVTCVATLRKGAWYRLRIFHTERLPELYVGATIMGGVRMQFLMPWGYGVEHYTDFDIGGEPQERLLTERACPEVVSAAPPAPMPVGGLAAGLEVDYYAYDDYACAVFEDALTPVCQDEQPNLRLRTGATGSWFAGDFLTMRHNPPSQNPTACEVATSQPADWAARMRGYWILERQDESAPNQIELRLDGDVNDGFRLTIYDWQTGAIVCVVDTMWNDAPGGWNYQSMDSYYSNIMLPNHCARPHTYDVGKLYPVTVDYYHHKTGGSRDEAEMDTWWRGLGNQGLASALYHQP